jgi:hypothetical protein
MKQNIYVIREYNMIDCKLYTHELMQFDSVIAIKEDKGEIKSISGIFEGKPLTMESNRYYSLSNKPKGYEYRTEYLPYIATLTEDLPCSCKGLKPATYKGCKLMTEKHGGYLQFFHPKTKQVLRIAIHSHFYNPTN